MAKETHTLHCCVFKEYAVFEHTYYVFVRL